VGERGAALADEFRRDYASVDELLTSLSDTDWGLPCHGEGCSVGYVAHHIGHGIVRPRGWGRRSALDHGAITDGGVDGKAVDTDLQQCLRLDLVQAEALL
jgi:hypothetical protein